MDPISWSVYHTGPVSRDAVRGRIRLTYFSFSASRSAHVGHQVSAVALLRTHPPLPLVRRNQRELASDIAIQRYGRVDR